MSSPAPLGVLKSAIVSGVRSTLVTVEVHRDDGIPSQTIVGLPGKAVRESLDRIRGACRSSDVRVEPRRTTINLAPADHPKGGSGLDLPIALGMLVADGELPAERLAEAVCLGELQLDGSVRPVPGVLPAALAARDAGIKNFVVARDNAAEAAAVEGVSTVPVGSLSEAMEWARGGPAPLYPLPPQSSRPLPDVDLGEVAGHVMGRRALEVAAAGGHHLLMVGLPGSGKTMLARALAGILPELSDAEALETSAVYSVVDQLGCHGLMRHRPFRAPHHSVTAAGLIGGGVPPKPGETSLAHCGVLFLDELAEFRRAALETLRQPLEEGSVSLVRGGRAVVFPSRFQLVAAMNPCPCGQGRQSDACRCTLGQVRGYWRRLSGPLLDRLDIVVSVEPVPLDDLITARIEAECSDVVRARVAAARARQLDRSTEIARRLPEGAVRSGVTNATLPASALDIACRLDESQRRRARRDAERLGISARGWHRVLRVARSIADLDGRDEIRYQDLAEGFQYRQGAVELAATAALSE